LLLSGILGLVLLLAGWAEALRPVAGPHNRIELAVLRADGDLPVIISAYFTTAGRCAGCHGHDPNGLASIDSQGRDVNVADDWRSTMMANSARDPFFRAKVRHEVIVNPEHQVAIENKCLGCHAPLGMHEERILGNPPFTMAHMDTSRLGQDGVSCLSCHMLSEATSGNFFSGELEFDSARVYGPYADDEINPAIMQSFVGFTPGQGTHFLNSKVCAGCHTLITETLDLDGNLTGDRFVEQATYHEWLNSVYSANGTQCNTCHMPRLDEPIILAADYAFLAGQQPFGLHHLAGANVHMLQVLKANKDALGIPATDAQFDSTIYRTQQMLTQRTLDAFVMLADRTADTIYYDLRLENRAGHRFPSGYPSRRAFVEFVVLTADGDTVFKSGRVNSAYEVEGHDAGYEPHYDKITSNDQVQIYELVMGDVNGDVTTVLERAKDPIKDNRLAPIGFTSTHPSYDTTRVAGVGAGDIDFNRNALGEEGNGNDVVHYNVPISGVSDGLRAFARIYYQPVPPGWNAEMFSGSHADITAFGDMLAASDQSPTLVAQDSLVVGPAGIADASADRVTIHPNPTADGWVTITGDADVEIVGVYDARGALVRTRTEQGPNRSRLQLPFSPGSYMVHLRVNGTAVLKRILRQ
jgi:Cytochrome c554 and c-prime